MRVRTLSRNVFEIVAEYTKNTFDWIYETDRQADGRTDRKTDRYTGKQIDRLTGRHADRQTYIQINIHIDI